MLKNRFLKIFVALLLACFLTVDGYAQTKGVTIYGTVVTSDSLYLVPNTHVINKRSYSGTVSNSIGEFMVEGNIGDTLIFSNVSFQFYYHEITGTEPDNLIIKLKKRNYLLDEVSVKEYLIHSNNPKPMTLEKPLIPSNSELEMRQSPKPTLGNPVDFLYYMFSNRAKQLEQLRELYAQDYYKQKLKEGNNRDIITNLTGLQKDELEAFMFYCKYANSRINTINDYEFLMSLLNCYDLFIKERELNLLLEEQATPEKVGGERFKD